MVKEVRLIDADLLMENLGFMDTEEEREENIGQIITWEDVDRMPTAYDPEKVIEKLQVLSDKADDDIAVCEADTCQYYDGYGDGLDRAIEIVKRGGRDEK